MVKIENDGFDSASQKNWTGVEGKSEKWRQKYGRNILSNIFHMAIKTIQMDHFNIPIQRVI